MKTQSVEYSEWIRALAAADMMAIEAIIADVCASRCQGAKGFVLFDGGAHQGYHTLKMGALKGCEAVYAVEADPAMAKSLQKILGKNFLKKLVRGKNPDYKLLVKALQGDPKVTSITWKSSTSHIGRSSIASSGDSKTIWEWASDIAYRDDVQVDATTIDKILASEKRAMPFLKLDLEGADMISLFGAKKTLKSKRPIVAFENSIHAPKVHGFTLDEVFKFLDSIDYIGVDFFGNRLSNENWFTFFEAWLVPAEDAAWAKKALRAAVNVQAHKVGGLPRPHALPKLKNI